MVEPRPEVIAAGAEVIKAAVAYVDARQQEVAAIALVEPYRRLETAVMDFHDATAD